LALLSFFEYVIVLEMNANGRPGQSVLGETEQEPCLPG
jgi:hypothetical protein